MNIFCKFGIMVRGDTVNTLKDIRITEIKSVSEIYSEKGRRFCMHNRESFGLSFCRGGQITYTQNEEKYISDKDNAIILPKGKSYSLKGDKTGIFPVVNFDCVGFSTDTFLILPLYNRELVIKDFEHIMELYGIAGKELKCISLLYDILYRLSADSGAMSPHLSRAVAYIENHFSQSELSNSELAEIAGISEVYLRRLFQKQFGVSPKQYILDMRIKKAEQFLTTNMRINDIAEKCGYASVYHFSRSFRQYTGASPTEYRNAHTLL